MPRKSPELTVPQKLFSDFYTPITLADLEKQIYTENLTNHTTGAIEAEMVVMYAYWVQRIQDMFKGITVTYANGDVPVIKLMDFSTTKLVSKFVVLEAFAFLKFTGVILDGLSMYYYYQGKRISTILPKHGHIGFLVGGESGHFNQGTLEITTGITSNISGQIMDGGGIRHISFSNVIPCGNTPMSRIDIAKTVNDYFEIPVGTSVKVNSHYSPSPLNCQVDEPHTVNLTVKLQRTAENRVVETKYHTGDTKPISKVVREFIGGVWVDVEAYHLMGTEDAEIFKTTYDAQGRVIKKVVKSGNLCGINTTSYVYIDDDPNKVRYIRTVDYIKGTPRKLRRVCIQTPSSNTDEYLLVQGIGDFIGSFMPKLVETFTECKRADDKISAQFQVPVYKWSFHDDKISMWCLGGMSGIEIYKSKETDTEGVHEATIWFNHLSDDIIEINDDNVDGKVLVSSEHGKILAADHVFGAYDVKDRYLMTRHGDDGVLESVCCDNPEIAELKVVELVQ